jgi:hypothetical protein
MRRLNQIEVKEQGKFKLRYIGIDFEFNNTAEKELNVICCAMSSVDTKGEIVTKSFELLTEEGRLLFTSFISRMKSKATEEHYKIVFLAFASEAEQRCFTVLGIEVFDTYWIDLHVEYKMLRNKSNKSAYGWQLINGVEVLTFPPPKKWETVYNDDEDEEEEGGKKKSSAKSSTGLAGCCYKNLSVKIDTEEKNVVRDIIINKTFTSTDMPRIMNYCESDVLHLLPLYDSMFEELLTRYKVTKDKQIQKVFIEQTERGIYGGLVAEMVHNGYPVSIEEARCFSASVPKILEEVKKDINKKVFDELGFEMFQYSRKDKKTQAWIPVAETKKGSKQVKLIGDYILKKREEGEYPYNKWALSEKLKKPVLKEEIISDLASGRSDFNDGFIDQLFRFTLINKTLNGFLPAKNGKRTLWDSIGQDGNARPYINQYGSQSSRSQPQATGFIPLKASWSRYLIQPPRGEILVSIDYGSEEYLISALVSNDAKMIQAYMSGDVYIAFGIEAKILPEGATKKSHGLIREKLKQVVLMVLYGSTEYGLSTKLYQVYKGAKDMDDCLEEAKHLINLFEDTYYVFSEYKDKIYNDYCEKGYLRLVDGWTMWGDNDNKRSVQNCPFQGNGGVVMREAHKIARFKYGLEVSFTLHDALTVRTSLETWKEDTKKLAQAMCEGFFKAHSRATEYKAFIKLDGKAWGFGLSTGDESIEYTNCFGDTVYCPTHTAERHIDPRTVKEFENFQPYFKAYENLF